MWNGWREEIGEREVNRGRKEGDVIEREIEGIQYIIQILMSLIIFNNIYDGSSSMGRQL